MEKANLLINNSIPIEQIKNNDIFTSLIDDLICLVCLNIPLEPIQCSKCDIVVCKDCLEILHLSQKNCLSPECQNSKASLSVLYVRTTKFVKEVLEKLNFTCEFCKQEGINYLKYKNHLDEKCEIYKSIEHKREIFIKKLREIREKEELLKKELDISKFRKLNLIEVEDSQEQVEEIRNKLLKNTLGPPEKKNYHNAIFEGNLSLFKSYILDKKYPIFEEISAKNYYWTSLHYAMHYGKWNIIEFLLKYLKEKDLYKDAMRLKSNDGRCPVLCLLKSNSLKNEEKKFIFEILLKDWDIKVTQMIKKEAIARSFDSLIEKYKK